MNEELSTPTCLSCQRQALLIEQLRQQIRLLEEQNRLLKARVDNLEAKLEVDSSNSHNPPSSDRPAKRAKTSNARREKRKRKRTGRRRGAQPGHTKHERTLVPAVDVDVLHQCKPSSCSGCGAKLDGSDPQPDRHQIVEIPPIKPHVTEYQLHTLECDCCGHNTKAKLPQGVSTLGYGPRVVAFVGLLCAVYHLSKRKVQTLMHEAFSVDMSLGTVVNLSHVCRDALATPVEAAQQFIKSEPVSWVDETSWKEAGRTGYLWVAVTSMVTVFILRLSRAKAVAQQLLGAAYKGVAHTDRYRSYLWLGVEHRQVCWAHLLRDFKAIAASKDGLADIGATLKTMAEHVFIEWAHVRDGPGTREQLADKLKPIKVAMKVLLERGSAMECERSGMCGEMLSVYDAFWTFLRIEGVEPTNNRAERAVRPAVIWRKLMVVGTQSRGGSLFVERLLTATVTLRQQGRDVLGWLTSATEAHLQSQPAPSLLPLQLVEQVETSQPVAVEHAVEAT